MKPKAYKSSPSMRQVWKQQLVQLILNMPANLRALHGHYAQAEILRRDVHTVKAALWVHSRGCCPATEPRTSRQEEAYAKQICQYL